MKKKITILVVILMLLGSVILACSFSSYDRVMSLSVASMVNTILVGEKIAVTKFNGDVKRGNLIVFKYPKDPSILYLMRVIGLPGETIEVRGKKVFINSKELSEKRIKVEFPKEMNEPGKAFKELAEEGDGTYRVFYEAGSWDGSNNYDQMTKYATKAPYQILPGQYFVMGDCRDNSMDSRYWGTVSHEAIIGKAEMILTSLHPERNRLQLK